MPCGKRAEKTIVMFGLLIVIELAVRLGAIGVSLSTIAISLSVNGSVIIVKFLIG